MAVHLVFGEEEYLIERNSEEIVKSFLSGNTKIINAEKVKSTFLEGYEIIHVKNCKIIPEINFIDSINYVISFIPKAVPQKNLPYIYYDQQKLKSSEYRNEVIMWILNEGKRHKIDLSKVSGALFVNSGNSLRKLSSEILKLKTLTAEGEMVSPDVAKSLLVFSNELTPKSILDAICEGNTKKAIAFYDRLQDAKNETGWILAYLQTFVVQILRARYMTAKGMKDIPGALSISGYIYNNFVSPHLGKWEDDLLKDVLRNLNDIEKRHKSGRNNADFLLELEIFRLSEGLKTRKRVGSTGGENHHDH